MSAQHALLILIIGIALVLAAGCTLPAQPAPPEAGRPAAPDATPEPTSATPVTMTPGTTETTAPAPPAGTTQTTTPKPSLSPADTKFLVHFPWTAGEAWKPSTGPHDPELALDFHVEGYSGGPDEKPLAVRAAAPGTVFYAAYSSNNAYYTTATGTIADYGNMVVLQHDGAYTMYTHLKQESPAPLGIGDAVTAGQRIGWMGYSGWSKTATQRGAHLHFAVIEGIDPTFTIIPKADWGFYELDGSKSVVLEKDYVSQNTAA